MGDAGPRVCGIVLAAGAGTRFGGPKALAADGTGVPWVVRVVGALRAGGCDEVLVALGADSARAARLVPSAAEIVRVDDWASGLSATVRAGLDAAALTDADAVILAPVDAPGIPASAVARIVDALGAHPYAALVRATYRGRPGHPVALGRDHWASVSASLSGDRGAGAYLAARGAASVECSDLWDGADIDRA